MVQSRMIKPVCAWAATYLPAKGGVTEWPKPGTGSVSQKAMSTRSAIPGGFARKPF
jgi:hypothetical protein